MGCSRMRSMRVRMLSAASSRFRCTPSPSLAGRGGWRSDSAFARSTDCSAKRRIGWSRGGRIETSRSCAVAGGVPVHAIQRLAAADAFRSMGLDRRSALWDSRALKAAPDLPLFAYAEACDEGSEAEPAQLPAMPLAEHVVNDYQTIRLSLKAHPMTFLREHYARAKIRHRRSPEPRSGTAGGCRSPGWC